jgi:hypothetical protein
MLKLSQLVSAKAVRLDKILCHPREWTTAAKDRKSDDHEDKAAKPGRKISLIILKSLKKLSFF